MGPVRAVAAAMIALVAFILGAAVAQPSPGTADPAAWFARYQRDSERVPIGGGMGAGPFHSQNMEAWFTHTAGLKVIEPSTPYDAKGLLLAAFEDGNPVLFLEHKGLYRSAKGPVPKGPYTLPIGKARIAREGTDATVVTYGVGVVWALEAATTLA